MNQIFFSKVTLKFAILFLTLSVQTLSAQILTSSNLPIVIISTDVNPMSGQPHVITDDPRVLATMKIIRRPDGSRNYLSDQNTASFLNYNGRINIETRGSTSQMLPKNGYGFTTLQADNSSNNNVSLLGMPSENDWILNGLAFDPSLMRDYLSYNLSAMMGNYAPRSQYCEVVINGDYKGLYLLQEKIKADSDRVNILKITQSDDAGENLSGGYITKADKTTGGDPVAWTMSSYSGWTDFIHDLPKPEQVTPLQHNYIRSVFINLAAAAQSHNANLVNGYPSIIDLPSFMDFMIVNEVASNADAYQLSTYFHKDRNGKLRAGPVWDHNLTYGNDLFMFGLDRSHYDVWQFDDNDNTGARFWKDLFNDPVFRCRLAKRFDALRSAGMPLDQANLFQFIDNAAEYISEAVFREIQRWGTIPDHPQEIVSMKSFLNLRLDWMTEHLGSFDACAEFVAPPLVISKINYNPGTFPGFPQADDLEFIEITNTGNQNIDLTGIHFRQLGITYGFPANAVAAPGAKLYLASNPAVFQQKYGIAAFGKFTRNLSNKSQRLELADGLGNTIDFVEYKDSSPWPDADGNGQYLTLSDVSLDNSLASSWTVSGASLSVNDFSQGHVWVYPNPTDGILNLPTTSQDVVRIYDMTGRKVMEVLPNGSIINLAELPTGIYVLAIQIDGNDRNIRIIRQ